MLKKKKILFKKIQINEKELWWLTAKGRQKKMEILFKCFQPISVSQPDDFLKW